MSDVAKMKEAAFPAPTVEEWEREAEKSLKGKPLERLVSMTYENIAVKPLYTRCDVEALGPLEQYPGFGQYVRGARPEGYRGGPWKVSQEISAASPSEWNEAVKHDLERGQTEIHFALGRLPFAVESVEDVAAMFAGVPLDRYSLRVDAGARVAFVFGAFGRLFRGAGSAAIERTGRGRHGSARGVGGTWDAPVFAFAAV